nr:hypothetical protein LSAT_8X94221 [Ipomoea batatas]GMD20065.1 hypothetical protein LSAT_8X94221 [Ipomoea batatas]
MPCLPTTISTSAYLLRETNMNWNWTSRDIGKSSGLQVWKRKRKKP